MLLVYAPMLEYFGLVTVPSRVCVCVAFLVGLLGCSLKCFHVRSDSTLLQGKSEVKAVSEAMMRPNVFSVDTEYNSTFHIRTLPVEWLPATTPAAVR